ncbi:hypothetical protein ACLECQ_08110 [Lonsdalea quercina]
MLKASKALALSPQSADSTRHKKLGSESEFDGLSRIPSPQVLLTVPRAV